MPRDVAIIVNPVAGSGKRGQVIEQFRARLLAEGHRCTMALTSGPADLTNLVRQKAVDETCIVIAGGDGTIRGALAGLMGRSNPVLILPLGTENILAKQLGIAPTFASLWRAFSSGQVTAFDLGTVNGQPFLTIVGAGFDAEVVARLSQRRRGHITHFDYFWPVWRTLCKYRFPPIRVLADGEEVCNEPALVFAGNIPRYAAGLRILRDARWNDGLLDLCIFRCRHQARLMEHAFWTWLNWHIEHPLVSYHQVKHVRIESETALPLQSDGDPAGELPAEVEVVPAALNLLVPPRAGQSRLADR
ncbi:MAG: diacylglycerol kinase family lipid kinase [Planctomycetes bacterium]|nr:diacylglycerol kinase family lipid kinase [Planctomycetota bacterium]